MRSGTGPQDSLAVDLPISTPMGAAPPVPQWNDKDTHSLVSDILNTTISADVLPFLVNLYKTLTALEPVPVASKLYFSREFQKWFAIKFPKIYKDHAEHLVTSR